MADEHTSGYPVLETLRQAARTLGVGFAVVAPKDWSIVFENGSLFKWFPPESDAD